jgi:hypothetical protein
MVVLELALMIVLGVEIQRRELIQVMSGTLVPEIVVWSKHGDVIFKIV